MLPKRLSVKFFAKNPEVVTAKALVPVMQRWIQDTTVPGMLIDVADYSHVPDGPGIMLIAHEGDYAYEYKEGRPGLSYVSKRPVADTLAALLGHVFHAALTAAQQLAQDEALNGVEFDLTRVEIAFVDRLHTPNTGETFAALVEQITLPIALTRVDNDPRGCLTVEATPTDHASFVDLLAESRVTS